jgi:UDP-glucose 4-epimerase
MRIAIVGGTGMVGSATAARAARDGCEVTVMSRAQPASLPRGARWLLADVTQPAAIAAALEETRPEVLVHLASYLQFACDANPAEAVRVNIDGMVNVLEACRAARVRRVVFGSSIAAYGHREDTMREDDPIPANVGLYGMTKRVAELLGARYRALHGLEFVALRYSGVIGPGESHSPGMALVRHRIKQCALGRDVRIEGASGEERVHVTHATDAAEATMRAATCKSPSHLVYNVAGPDGNYVTLREFHRAVCEVAPGAGRAIWCGSARSAGLADTSRARHDLAWTPNVGLHDALRLDLFPQDTPLSQELQ